MEQEPQDIGTTRVQLLLNLGSFQLKLLLDWLRDLLLAPVSFFAVIYGIVAGGDKPDQYYNRLMAFGRRSDRFINLFDEYSDEIDSTDKNSDDYLAPYKDRLLEEARSRGLTDKANQLLDGKPGIPGPDNEPPAGSDPKRPL